MSVTTPEKPSGLEGVGDRDRMQSHAVDEELLPERSAEVRIG
jgi:hypothetical protein